MPPAGFDFLRYRFALSVMLAVASAGVDGYRTAQELLGLQPVHGNRLASFTRLRKRRCELCEHGATVAVHQVARLAHLGRPGPGQPAWAALMAKMRRKTLIVCAACHDWIHANPVADAA